MSFRRLRSHSLLPSIAGCLAADDGNDIDDDDIDSIKVQNQPITSSSQSSSHIKKIKLSFFDGIFLAFFTFLVGYSKFFSGLHVRS